MNGEKSQKEPEAGTSTSSKGPGGKEQDDYGKIKMRIQEVNHDLAGCQSHLKKIKTALLIATATGQHQGLAGYMAAAKLDQVLERLRELLGDATNTALAKPEKECQCQEMEAVTQEINGLQKALEGWNLQSTPEDAEEEQVPK